MTEPTDGEMERLALEMQAVIDGPDDITETFAIYPMKQALDAALQLLAQSAPAMGTDREEWMRQRNLLFSYWVYDG